MLVHIREANVTIIAHGHQQLSVAGEPDAGDPPDAGDIFNLPGGRVDDHGAGEAAERQPPAALVAVDGGQPSRPGLDVAAKVS